MRCGVSIRVTVALGEAMSVTTAIRIPEGGAKIVPGEPVPDNPIIPFIEGDGIGVDITPVMREVVDAAVAKAYGGARRIAWMEVYAGEKSTRVYGADEWLPTETLATLRENAEDIYAGIEWEAESDSARRIISFLQDELGVRKIRFPDTSGIGIKPVSREGTERLVRRAIQYALENGRASLTLVHKGNIMKFTEGAFRDWGYALAEREFDAKPLDGGPWMTIGDLVVKDMIADAFLQQILLRPREYDVIATTNLNGDYISDALAAQVGGIGIAPGANMSDDVAVFEATHGTAPKYAGQDKVNPGSLILSAEMMLRHIGWREAADLIVSSMEAAIGDKQVTYDFARLLDGATEVSTSAFGRAMIERM